MCGHQRGLGQLELCSGQEGGRGWLLRQSKLRASSKVGVGDASSDERTVSSSESMASSWSFKCHLFLCIGEWLMAEGDWKLASSLGVAGQRHQWPN